MAKLRRTRGIVLVTRDVQETDRLALILSEKEGKIPLLVKRARRMESPYGAIFEPTNTVEFIYYVREGPYLLKEGSLLRLFPGLRGDWERLRAALEGLAMVAELLPERSPEPRALRLVQVFLRELEGGLDPGLGLLAFQLKFLSLLGQGPHLEGCVRCGSQEGLTWCPAEGLLCHGCGGRGEEVPPNIWRGMRMLLQLPLGTAGVLRLTRVEKDLVKRLLEEFRGHLRGGPSPQDDCHGAPQTIRYVPGGVAERTKARDLKSLEG